MAVNEVSVEVRRVIASASNPNAINGTENTQSRQLTEPQNIIYPFSNQLSQTFRHPAQQPLAIHRPEGIEEGNLCPPSSLHLLPDDGTDQSKANKLLKRNRNEKDKEKEIKDKKNQIWQEREREWKLLQQQRQLENRKQQQQSQDNYIARNDARRSLNNRKSKIPDWRKNASTDDDGTSEREESLTNDGQIQSCLVTSNGDDNGPQYQTPGTPSSVSMDNLDSGEQDENSEHVTADHRFEGDHPADHRFEGDFESSHGQVLPQAMSTSFQMPSITTISQTTDSAPWPRDSPHCSGNSTPQTTTPPRTTPTPDLEHEVWFGQQQQQQQQQQQLNQQAAVDSRHSLNKALALLVPPVPDPSTQLPVVNENGPLHPLAMEAHHAFPPMAAASQLALRPDVATPLQFSLHNEQSIPSNSPLHQQQHQQQQAELLQREQRKQLVRAQQQQQQEYLQMQFKQQQQLVQQQAYPAGQPQRQANQFTATSKEMPEIDSEEEHQERLKFLYRQIQMQKQLKAQQYVLQQQVPSGVWLKNAPIMPGLSPRLPSDPVQQQMILEHHRASQLHDIRQNMNFDKVTHDQQTMSTLINQAGMSGNAMDPSSRFNFGPQVPKNGGLAIAKNSHSFLPTTQVTHSSIIPPRAASVTTSSNTSIFSGTLGGNDERTTNKGGKKDKRTSADKQANLAHQKDMELPSDVAQTVLGTSLFSGGIDMLQQAQTRDDSKTMQSEHVMIDEGNRVSLDGEGARRNERKLETHVSDELKANSQNAIHPYGAVSSTIQSNQTDQLLLPSPQVSLPPQQQNLISQAQQRQLLWQQAHAQLQHQYQILYQQLQQLQVQLQQTQDPGLHQQVLRQQQQLQFLQTQILQHWQQGQIVVQQIHLQAFELNAMYSQMDPTQQNQIQAYQQELIRQQQQWAQQFGGTIPSGAAADALGLPRVPGAYPNVPQEIRPQSAEVSTMTTLIISNTFKIMIRSMIKTFNQISAETADS